MIGPILVRMAYQPDRALIEAAAFAAVAEAGGFSAAARAGGLRKATLTERVRSLEARLGVSLLVRTTRTLRLTDDGRAYLEHARRALDAVRAADAAATSARPTGTVRVSVLPPLADVLLAEVVAPYLSRHPEVSVVFDASIGHVDLARERVDVAVRVGPLVDSALICRRLATLPGGYYASPAYVARRGAPSTPDALASHDTIAMSRGDRLPSWRFARGGRSRTVVVRPRLQVAAFEQGIAAAVAGAGIVPSPPFAVRRFVDDGTLVQVLRAWTPATFDVYAVHPAGRAAARIQVFVEALVAWFARRRGRF
jgi:DNA-binding transcriptional LysR family regulator